MQTVRCPCLARLNAAQHVRASRPERHADADFLCGLRHGIGNDAVDAGDRKNRSEVGEDGHRRHAEAALLERSGDQGVDCTGGVHRQFRVEPASDGANARD